MGESHACTRNSTHYKQNLPLLTLECTAAILGAAIAIESFYANLCGSLSSLKVPNGFSTLLGLILEARV